MYLYTEGHSRVAGTGIYLPEQRVSTRELLQEIDSKNRFGVPDSWIERVTGIREKRVTSPGILPSDMAAAAAKEAMERARVLPHQIDAVIYTGLTRDHLEPATAHLVQDKAGTRNAMVFDISNACHGFMNGIHVMDALIASGQVRHGLVVTGEQGSIFSRRALAALKETSDRAQFNSLVAALTVGDAGAAFVMQPKKNMEAGFAGLMLQSQGQYARLCTMGDPWTEHTGFADMPAIIGEAAKLISRMFSEFMYERLRWRIQELAKCLIHQVSTGGLFKAHHLAGVPQEIMPKTVDMLGNLITANIPLSVHYCVMNQELKEGNKLYLSGTGSGISLGQAGLIWDAA